MDIGMIVVAAMILMVVIILAKTAVVVPQQSQYVVERLGKYTERSMPGFTFWPRFSIPSVTATR